MNKKSGRSEGVASWVTAVRLLVKYDRGRGHLDLLLDRMDPGQARWLVMSVFRHRLSIDERLELHWERRPREVALNLLRLALAEILEKAESEHPQITHHAVAVGRALGMSRAEAGFVNAVLRRCLGTREERPLESTHPAWLVSRWRGQFGEAALLKLLAWNQGTPRLMLSSGSHLEGLVSTPWPGYYWIGDGTLSDFEAELRSGSVYVQDAFARLPVDLLSPCKGETILDLCAAPGGKTRLIQQRLGGEGRVYAVDSGPSRMERLKENVTNWDAAPVIPIEADVEEMEEALCSVGCSPGSVDGVLLDVPCSNTGVMQKRPDVKLRLSEAVIKETARVQQRLLCAAAKWVRRGGRLVYSTCSLEPEENADVVRAFIEANPDWQFVRGGVSTPWEAEHDGGGAFLLTRQGAN